MRAAILGHVFDPVGGALARSVPCGPENGRCATNAFLEGPVGDEGPRVGRQLVGGEGVQVHAASVALVLDARRVVRLVDELREPDHGYCVVERLELPVVAEVCDE